jgi:hypothetical protein
MRVTPNIQKGLFWQDQSLPLSRCIHPPCPPCEIFLSSIIVGTCGGPKGQSTLCGCGNAETLYFVSSRRKVMRSFRSLAFLSPPKAIFVPGMYFLGFSRYSNWVKLALSPTIRSRMDLAIKWLHVANLPMCPLSTQHPSACSPRCR